MKLKYFAIIATLSITLFASGIEFQYLEQSSKRVLPNEQNEILSYHSVVKDAMKSVVNISTKKITRTSFYSGPFGQMFNDPFFKHFFGRGFGDLFPQERVERSLGSGVILTHDGYIVTNNHVIENADEIIVALGENNKEYSATIIGTDKDSDLALIKIEAKNLHPIKLSRDRELLVGDVVFAIGNPFGVGQTVTKGIVSATNRDQVGINRYENFIQTDASINPGNSGGALIDSRGALVGINSAILTKSGANNGIGFAIPVYMVEDVVRKLAKSGKVERGYLGVTISNLSNDAKSLYTREKGALVLDVAEGTPAHKAGLKRGDLIFSVDGKKIESSSELTRVIGSYSPNSIITLGVERNKKEITIKLKLASRDGAMSASIDRFVEGLSLAQITRENAQKFRIPSNIRGVLVTDVKPSSKAEKLGFQPGDVIIQVEGMEIETVEDLNTAINKYRKGAKRVFINRYGQILMQIVE